MRLTSLLLLACAPLAAQPSILRLVATADVSASQDQPSTNLGSDVLVTSGKDFASSPFRVWMTRGHYLFDLTPLNGLPAPTRVRLRVFQAQSFAAGCLDVTLHRITSAWTESTVTWQNKPTHDAAVSARQCVGDSATIGFKTFDVTALVAGWAAGTYPNHGLLIRDPSESTAGAARPLHGASREAADPTRHPHLEVAWDTMPYGTGCGPSASVPALDLADGLPMIGTSYTLRAENMPGSAPVAHILGVSDSSWSGVTLPLNLGFMGYPACHLYASPDVFLAGVADFRGRASLTMPVPALNSLRNRRFFHQTLGVDSALVLALTNGFAVRVF